ncbi:hypothetical protein BDY19DRAFT_997142 [Irpex rosettiformis]|uniref:Uncharacterized protein n=1 Tax=Irpex rosettiformis TaxID=378272 RepID=A0ACB8TTA9_9APHY|nr:hypothetical protein BDY19DRAFT_997142 [Irpex rosettiformis]
MAFGGLSILLYGGRSFVFSAEGALRKVDLQSAFFALVFVIVLLVLAYLTNPSETSFRTYLTEQSFRQHLSRLEDNNQEDQTDSDDSGVHFSLTRRISKAHTKNLDSFSSQPFHFVNRAAVSLRTPKHVFYSFGIMTIAAVLPTGTTNRSGATSQTDGFMVSESWFIGAFGKWWRGGPIQAWWVENAANMKDTERCSSGVLDMKPLDALECYDVGQLPITCRESAAKPRVSERLLQRATNSAPRSTTPPPLPKSASLPLHVTRVPHDKQHGIRQPTSQPAITISSSEPARVNPPALLPSPSTIFDQSPVISDILRQITNSKTAVHDLRTQLKDFRAAAVESHALIQSDLDVHRERKRTEDAARAELKTRTKTLEDSKRTAEASKREAEKRLRAAESARNNASERVQRLDNEIGVLRLRMGGDEEAIVQSKQDGDDMNKEMAEQLERKRKEIKVAEEVIAALNSRAKELEGKIAAEEERLKHAKEQADMKKQDRAFNPLHIVSEPVEVPAWSPIVPEAEAVMAGTHSGIHTCCTERTEAFIDTLPLPVVGQAQVRRSSIPEVPQQLATSPRPRHLSLGSLSNFRNHSMPLHVDAELPADDVPPLTSGRTQSTKFSPFSDQDLDILTDIHGDIAISPRSTSLIPTSLIKTLDGGGTTEDLSRSFQSENDSVLDRNWRKLHPFPVQAVENAAVFSSSPTSLNFPSFDAVDQEDIFEIRPPPPPLRHRITSDGLETERVYLTNTLGTDGIGLPLGRARTHEAEEKAVATRRWFSSSKQEDKKGLNPEAKAFHLKKLPLFGGSKPASIDSLLSHGSTTSSLSLPALLAPPSSTPDSILSAVSMRAFAPSPEEREALTRAMGSANTSLERLPGLSNVMGGISSSPNHTHSIGSRVSQASMSMSDVSSTRGLLNPGFSWLHPFPKLKRNLFSPWDDEVVDGNDAASR